MRGSRSLGREKQGGLVGELADVHDEAASVQVCLGSRWVEAARGRKRQGAKFERGWQGLARVETAGVLWRKGKGAVL